jgi:hypothetical protein
VHHRSVERQDCDLASACRIGGANGCDDFAPEHSGGNHPGGKNCIQYGCNSVARLAALCVMIPLCGAGMMTPRSKKPKTSSGRGSNPADRSDDLDDAALDRLVGGRGEPGPAGGTDPWSRPLTDHDLPVGAKRPRRPGRKPD